MKYIAALMQLHIFRHGEQRGPFSHMKITEMLRAGEISKEDLAWQMGMETWMPLRTLQEFHESPGPPALPRGRSVQTAEMPPSGGRVV